MDDPKTEDRSGEMEHDLHKLEDHIADAEKKLEARKKDAADGDVAGEWEGEQDRGGGDDPTGAAEASSAPADEDERADEDLANPT